MSALVFVVSAAVGSFVGSYAGSLLFEKYHRSIDLWAYELKDRYQIWRHKRKNKN